jgi:acetyl-CoA acetyltransferase
MNDVHVLGGAVTPFGVHLDRSVKQMTAEAIELAIKDANLGMDDIGGIFYGNCLGGAVQGLQATRGPIACLAAGFGQIPIHSVENACATGATAVHMAYLAVAAGVHDTVLAVGCEKANHEDRRITFQAFASGFDPDENIAELFHQSAGAGETRTNSVDRHAVLAREVMADTGLTIEDFAALASVGLQNAADNPNAHRQHGATPQAVLDASVAVAPLTKLMMCPISDGAAAAVISRQRATDGRGVRIAASRVASRSALTDPDGPSAGRSALNAVYAAADLRPDDVDVAELHDASITYLVMSLRDSGLCPPGEEIATIREGRTRIDGAIPVNTSGGLLGRGHAVGATGVAQIVELTQQLRGEAGTRQVHDPRVALAHVGGGVIGFKTAVSGATLLVRD